MIVEVKRVIHIDRSEIDEAVVQWVKAKLGYGGTDGLYASEVRLDTCELVFPQGDPDEGANLLVGVKEAYRIEAPPVMADVATGEETT